jgi:phospholipase/carboxylesterase
MRRIGQLECVEIWNPEENSHKEKPWVVMFHGYGADCNDLAQLPNYIPNADQFNWLFPNGIQSADVGQGMSFGRAWWPIDVMALQVAAMRGETRDLSNQLPEGLASVRKIVLTALQQLKVPWDQIILGGFSQGAMLATDIYLHAPSKPGGLMVFSGTALAESAWLPLLPQKSGESFFMCHGKNDPILSIKGAQKLETWLTQTGGMKGHLDTFNGAHEIPQQALTKAGDYLKNYLLK